MSSQENVMVITALTQGSSTSSLCKDNSTIFSITGLCSRILSLWNPFLECYNCTLGFLILNGIWRKEECNVIPRRKASCTEWDGQLASGYTAGRWVERASLVGCWKLEVTKYISPRKSEEDSTLNVKMNVFIRGHVCRVGKGSWGENSMYWKKYSKRSC